MTESNETNGAGQGEFEFGDDDDVVVGGRSASARRSPIISGVVILIGAYLLITMFADVRYWMRGAEPRDLGEAAAFVESGGLQGDLDEQFVSLSGTPDAQNAARYKLGERQIQLLRITEGRASLFAAVPRVAGQAPDQYSGQYEGRARRLSDSAMLPWIQQYFADLQISESHKASAAALQTALTDGSGRVTADDGAVVRLTPEDTISLSTALPDVRVQLGRKSFKRLTAAREAITALGYPVFEPEKQGNAKFYQFWARIPDAERKAASDKLNAGLEAAPEGAQAAYGAVILPGSATFMVGLSELTSDGESFQFPRKDGMPSAGFKVEGATLVADQQEGATLRIPMAQVRSVHLQQPLVVDPSGYLIHVGERPENHRFSAALWFAGLLVVALNVASLLLYWRRRNSL